MEKSVLPEDFRDFLNILKQRKVKFLIVGGWALGVHGYIRATADLDIWISVDDRNVDFLIEGLREFGVPEGVPKSFFQESGNAFRMGQPPMRIEIITEASGVDFNGSYERREEVDIGGLNLPFIGYKDFVKNKKSSGRYKDLADLEALGEI